MYYTKESSNLLSLMFSKTFQINCHKNNLKMKIYS